jgi:hypothetical protein
MRLEVIELSDTNIGKPGCHVDISKLASTTGPFSLALGHFYSSLTAMYVELRSSKASPMIFWILVT